MSALSNDPNLSVFRRLELALDASGIGIWEHNASTGDITWDGRLRELYGLDPVDSIRWIELVHPMDRSAALEDFNNAINTKSGYFSQFRILLPDGQIKHVRSKARYYQDENGDALMIGAEWDVTDDVLIQEDLHRRTEELEELRRQADYAATHDYLTGLPNRRALDKFIQGVESSYGNTRAVLHIDLDNFKELNDALGHGAGDEYLRRFAHGLGELTPSDALACRVGGDEFLVMLPAAAPGSALLLATAIIAHAEELSAHLGNVSGSASVGVSLGHMPWRKLLTSSDRALYEAKGAGRGCFKLHDATQSAGYWDALRQ